MNREYVRHLTNIANERVEQHQHGMDDRIGVADKINTTLKDLVLKCGAIRGYIFELHNSVNNLTGLPFAKFSMTYEFFQDGERPVIHDYQNLSLSTLAPVIYELYQTQFMTINTATPCERFRSIQWFLTSRNAQTVVFLPLKDTEGKIFAIAGFDFSVPQEGKWELDDVEKVFIADCARICGYLDFKHI